MARTKTFLQLQDEVYERADVQEAYITRPEMRRLVNAGIARLYRLMVSSSADWVETDATLAITSGTAAYDLPEDLWQVRTVAYLDGTTWVPIRRAMSSERFQYQTNSIKADTRYRVRDSGVRIGGSTRIELIPTPTWSGSVKVWYLPNPPQLTTAAATDDAAPLDGVAGWDEMVVLDAVIKIKAKQEEDPTVEAASLAALEAEVRRDASDRDQGEPKRVRDVSCDMAGTDDWWRRP